VPLAWCIKQLDPVAVGVVKRCLQTSGQPTKERPSPESTVCHDSPSPGLPVDSRMAQRHGWVERRGAYKALTHVQGSNHLDMVQSPSSPGYMLHQDSEVTDASLRVP
jgi:hypothetical protein